MGRDPIPCRLGFPGPPRRGAEGVSGISLGFPRLSRSKGQVGHVLLTRSPLHVRPRAVSSFDLHVLGTPPAFILSQDQTLRLRGGNRFPLKSDLGFGPRPPPVLRVRARAGFPFARIVCLAFLFFAVQYPVFKVLRRPSRGPVAFGSTRSARRYITRPLPAVKNFFRDSRTFFPAPSGAGGPRGPAAALPLSRGEGSPSMLPASGPGRKGGIFEKLGKARSERPGARGRAARGGRIPVPAARSRRRAGAVWPTMPRPSCFGPGRSPSFPHIQQSGTTDGRPAFRVMVDATRLSQAAAYSCRPCHRRHRP